MRFLTALALTFALAVTAFQRSDSADSRAAMLQRAQTLYEHHKQAAFRINDLAGRIRTENDARAYVSEIAGLFEKEVPPVWAQNDILQRIAHAEYEAVSDPTRHISEQRIVNLWNQYIHEIGAPEEAVVTAAEIHNMRDAGLTVAQTMWARGTQTVWTMPNMYALGADGKVADGCRAVETLRVIHDLEGLFQNLRSARDRVQKGVVPSEEVKKRVDDSIHHPTTVARLVAHADTNPVRPAEQRYVRDHGSRAFDQLLKRLFEELFPSE